MRLRGVDPFQPLRGGEKAWLVKRRDCRRTEPRVDIWLVQVTAVRWHFPQGIMVLPQFQTRNRWSLRVPLLGDEIGWRI